MGIPIFFSWLSKKYEGVVGTCRGVRHANDSSTGSGYDWVDNLYVDMNGIIHPCAHPEGRPAPQNESEIYAAISDYLDRIIEIVRPRRLLYLAVDGVAPTAKMNQQRVRRLRASIDRKKLESDVQDIRSKLESENVRIPEIQAAFDSNSITPGTEFMERLMQSLQSYIRSRVSSRPGWLNLAVILSDSSVPGEGEHKIMDFIRKQKNQPSYDRCMKHCLFGADADLIMLALATHEQHFTIMRAIHKHKLRDPCHICNSLGHVTTNCTGTDNPGPTHNTQQLTPDTLLYVNIGILRHHLAEEFRPKNPERAIDDWVFMCFLVGNDFLPCLPSLAIRSHGIEKLTRIYRECRVEGYLTDCGELNMMKLQDIMEEVGLREKRELNRCVDTATLSYLICDDNYKIDYYKTKLDITGDAIHTKQKLTEEYIKGLVWVLKYYIQGCPSWNWFYPYHYAPLASDFIDIPRVTVRFEKSTPFQPLCQLMAILPAASRDLIPTPLSRLMIDECSPILDFYPNNYVTDLNGARVEWQGVALLPFIDERRLLTAIVPVLNKLSEREKRRNSHGRDILFMSGKIKTFESIEILEERFSERARRRYDDSINRKIFVEDVREFQKSLLLRTDPHRRSSDYEYYSITFSNPTYPENVRFSFHNVPQSFGCKRYGGYEDNPRFVKYPRRSQ